MEVREVKGIGGGGAQAPEKDGDREVTGTDAGR